MEDRIQILEKEVAELKERNRRVETDKAWETGTTRIIAISILTYIFAVVFLYLINVERYYLNGLVPVVGFLLSTQTIPVLKSWWVNKHNGPR